MRGRRRKTPLKPLVSGHNPRQFVPVPIPTVERPMRGRGRPRNPLPTLSVSSERNIAFTNWQGKRVYFGPAGDPATDEAFRQFVAQAIMGNDSRHPIDKLRSGGLATANDIMAGFTLHAAEKYRKRGNPTGHVLQIRYAAHWLKQSGLGARLIDDFGPKTLREFRDWLASHPAQRWNATTISQYVKLIRAGFKWAVGEELIAESAHRSLMYVAPIRRGEVISGQRVRGAVQRRPVDAAVRDATLKQLTPHQALMVRVHELLALRPSELCAMTPANIQVRTYSGQRVGLYMIPGEVNKTQHNDPDHQRIAVIGPKALALIADRLASAKDDEPIFSPRVSIRQRRGSDEPGRHPTLTANKKPRRRADYWPAAYNEATYRVFIKRAAARAFPHPTLAKVPRNKLTQEQALELRAWTRAHTWTPYRLRHSGATAMVESLPLTTVRDLLGHSDVATTQNYVTTPIATMLDAAIKIG